MTEIMLSLTDQTDGEKDLDHDDVAATPDSTTEELTEQSQMDIGSFLITMVTITFPINSNTKSRQTLVGL